MTERERMDDADNYETAEVYNTPVRSTPVRQSPTTTDTTTPRTNANDRSIRTGRSIDQVRWGPVIAGTFTALTTLATLAVLGLAIGLTTFDPTTFDPTAPGQDLIGMGVGVWGAISALIAFFLGGYMAGGTALVRGSNHGMLNGALVWIVATALLFFFIGSGVGAILGTATQAAAAVAGQLPADPAPQPLTPEQLQQATTVASQTAWSILLWLGLGAAAAIVGGYLGSQNTDMSRQTMVTA